MLITGCFFLNAKAQENSPFTRYGLGDVSPGSHSISRSMGGLTAAYADGQVNNVGQAINFGNPATYGSFFMVSYDLGLTDSDPVAIDDSVDFSVVGGLSEHIKSLKEMVLLPLLYPEMFSKFSLSPPVIP
jgi:hypothetical protein